MNNSRIKKMRIPVEIKQLEKSEKQHGIICLPSDEDFTNVEAIIPGPKSSAYEDGIFKLSVNFGEQYPFRPPNFKFVTPVYHPNIDNSGKICLDLLRMPPNGSYNPAITLESILLSIQLLLANPNVDDPLVEEAADLYKKDKTLFSSKAKEHVRLYASKGHFKKEVNPKNESNDDNTQISKKRMKMTFSDK